MKSDESFDGFSVLLPSQLNELDTEYTFRSKQPKRWPHSPDGLCKIETMLQQATILNASQSNASDPRDFFACQQDADWIAILNEWDHPREFRHDLLEFALNEAKTRRHSGAPCSAIVGPGGCGKSVTLRRLGADLLREGHRVWWVTSASAFTQRGIGELEEAEQTQFILFDDLERCTRNDLQFISRDIRARRDIVWIAACRELPNPAPWPRNDVRLFSPDELKDRVAILQKIASLVPEWKKATEALAAEQLQSARLIRVLWVLAHNCGTPATVAELERIFLEAIAYDVLKANEQVKGFSCAIADAAVLRSQGINIDHKTFITLTDLHEPGARSLLNPFNQRWSALRPLMSQIQRGSIYRWRFHHDELAAGIVRAGSSEYRMLGASVCIDKIWHRRLFDWLMEHGDRTTSSAALYSFFHHAPEVVPQSEIVTSLMRLIDENSDSKTHLFVATSPSLSIDPIARFDLIKRIAAKAPDNQIFWNAALKWCEQKCTPEQRQELAEILLDSTISTGYSPNTTHIIVICLKLLGSDRAKSLALRLLDESTSHEVLRVCLNILGEEAKEHAQRLLRVSKDHDVLCACIKILGTAAKEDILKLLAESKDHETLATCLKTLGPDAKEAARTLIKRDIEPYLVTICLRTIGDDAHQEARWLLENTNHPHILCTCLRYLGENAKEEARRLLLESDNDHVLGACLKILGQEAKEDAKRLLKSRHHHTVHCICLNILGDEATDEARAILAGKDVRVEVACRCIAILGEQAAEWAKAHIVKWREIRPELVAACLGAAWRTPEARAATVEMLNEWHNLPTQLKAAALGTPGSNLLRSKYANEVLTSWRTQRRTLVAAALVAHCDKPNAVTHVCRAIIHNWRKEIEHQRSRHDDRHDFHIIRSLSHPLLRQDARRAAQEMLEADAAEPGLLTAELRLCAQNTLRARYAPWAEAQRAFLRRFTKPTAE